MDYVIYSNNRTLEDTMGEIPVEHIKGGLDAMHAALEQALQNGHELVTAPLPPNVPLIRSPVRSIILRRTRRKYDAGGLLALSRAVERSQTLGLRATPETLADLEYIDRDHLLRAIGQLDELDSQNVRCGLQGDI